MISGLALSGAERILVSVLPYFKRIEGVTPLLCTLNTWRDSPLVEEFNQMEIERFDLGAKRLIDPPAWLRFTKLLKEEKIDIVSTQDQYSNLFGAFAFWFSKTPIVMTRHVMQEPADTFREDVRARLMLWAARYGSHKVIAVSDAVRQNLSKQSGMPFSKIETIYNGIEVERFVLKEGKDAIRKRLGWSADHAIVIMVAVLRRGKGHEVLFDAIPRLQNAIPNVRIKLVGDGELNDSLRQQAEKFGETVEFLGQRVDIPDLLNASDVLVLPSWSEALPTVLIEAGAASLPVVATKVGGTAEVVLDGQTGFLVEPGDSAEIANNLAKILENPGLARAMGNRAREKVQETFSLQRQAQSMVALFSSVMDKT